MDAEHQSIFDTAFKFVVTITNFQQEKMISVFDALESNECYNTYKKKKRSGGYRTISVPNTDLKKVQRKILKNFLYKISKKTEYYQHKEDSNVKHSINMRSMRKHLLPNYLHGMIPKRSIVSAVQQQCTETILYRGLELKNPGYIIEFDLQDAFGSVTQEMVKNVLYNQLLDDAKSFFDASKVSTDVRKHEKIFSQFRKDVQVHFCNEYSLGKPTYDILCRLGRLVTYSEIREFAWSWLERKGHKRNFDFEELTDPFRMRGVELFNSEVDFFASEHKKPNTLNYFRKHSLFAHPKLKELREFMRNESGFFEYFEETTIDQICELIAQYLSMICCRDNSLPQGAPTSGFLLNLVLNECQLISNLKRLRYVNTVSVYVDNIILGTNKKPDDSLLSSIANRIDASGIFRHHPDKIRVYDLRSTSASILGMQIVRRPANKVELESLVSATGCKMQPRGFVKAVRKNRTWFVTRATLSRKKQKYYRSVFHRVNTGKASKDEFNKALGYYGSLIALFGWPASYMPSALKDPIRIFREKFIKEKIE